MKFKRASIVVIAVLLAASVIAYRSFGDDSSSSSSLPHAATPDAPGLATVVSDFWTRWEGNKPSEAIRRAAPTPDFQRSWDPIGRYADEFQNRLGGRCLGHVEVARHPIGQRMIAVSYLALYEPTPLRVRMLFYRARDHWTPITLRIDANPARWMAEAEQVDLPDGEGAAPADDGTTQGVDQR